MLLGFLAKIAVVDVGHEDISLSALLAELLEHVDLAILAEDFHLLVEAFAAAVGGLAEAGTGHLPESVFEVGLLALVQMRARRSRGRILRVLALLSRRLFGGIGLFLI